MVGQGSIGKYSLVEPLGEDARCARWRAVAEGSGAEVLLTVMAPAVLGGAEGVARFRTELQRALGLNSPFIALVLDEGVADGSGAPFVVTELLRGQSLAERLSRVRLRARDVARYALQVGEALSEALEKGILHRDLRPENITLVGDPDEELVKIQDFGLASGVWAASLKAGQALVKGSPRAASYMSPEHLRSPKTVDHRADLWSLAVIVFECLTGRHPVEAGSAAQRSRLHLERGALPVPSSVGVVPLGFDEWFARATARDIRDRFQSATELTSALTALCCKPEGSESLRTMPRTPASLVGAPPAPPAPPSAGAGSVGAPSVGATSPPLALSSALTAPGATGAPTTAAAGVASGVGTAGAGLGDGGLGDGGLGDGTPVATIRRDELRFLLGAGALLGLGLVALTALWLRHGSPTPRASPAEPRGAVEASP